MGSELSRCSSQENFKKDVSISILMPVFNSGKYLQAAIDSIKNQEFIDFEFIIVDDGSTDNSSLIIEEAATNDLRIKHLWQPNSGIVSALNKALAVATGKYCARMDADDVSLPARLGMQYEFLESNPEIVALGGQGYIIDGDGDLICPLTVLSEHDAIDEDLLSRFNSNGMIHPSVMFRTDEARKIGGYDGCYPAAEDLDFFLKLAEVGRLANLSSIVIHYRKHGDSISDTKSVLMRKSAIKASNRARVRRGIAALSYVEPQESQMSQSRLDYMYSTALSALSNGYKATAFKYLRRMIAEHGFVSQSFKLALRIAVGPYIIAKLNRIRNQV